MCNWDQLKCSIILFKILVRSAQPTPSHPQALRFPGAGCIALAVLIG